MTGETMSADVSRRALLTGGLASGFLLAFHVPVRAVNAPEQPVVALVVALAAVAGEVAAWVAARDHSLKVKDFEHLAIDFKVRCSG